MPAAHSMPHSMPAAPSHMPAMLLLCCCRRCWRCRHPFPYASHDASGLCLPACLPPTRRTLPHAPGEESADPQQDSEAERGEDHIGHLQPVELQWGR